MLVIQQDQLIPNSQWKDYSSNTNYAFDAFGETDDKQKRGSRSGTSASTQQTLQMSHSPAKAQYYNNEGSRQPRHENYGGGGGGNGDHYNRYANSGENGSRSYHQNGHEPMARSTYADRTYSLPRTAVQQQQPYSGGYYTQDRRAGRNGHPHHSSGHGASKGSGIDTPDFYFMPSQRKYSGEVVRVYVDYNKDPKN